MPRTKRSTRQSLAALQPNQTDDGPALDQHESNNGTSSPKAANVAKKRTVSERSPALTKAARKKSTADVGHETVKTPTKEGSVESVECSEDKENLPITPGVTPYWKVAEERGMSPRLTRSAKKSNLPQYSDASLTPTRQSSAMNGDVRDPMKKMENDGDLFNLEYSSPNANETVIEGGGQNDKALVEKTPTNLKQKTVDFQSDVSRKKTQNRYCLTLTPEGRITRIDDSDKSVLLEEIASLKKKVRDLQTNLKIEKKEKVRAIDKKELLENEMRSMQNNYFKHLDARLTKLSNDQNELLQMNNKKDGDKDDGQNELLRMIHELRDENKALEAKLDVTEAKNMKLVADLENYQQDEKGYESFVNTLNEELSEHKKQREVSESNYRNIVADFETYYKKANDMEAAVTSLREELSTYKNEASSYRIKFSEAELNHKKVIEEYEARLNSQLGYETEEKLKMESEFGNIIASLEEKQTTIVRMSDREAEMKALNEKLLKKCASLEMELEETRYEMEQLQDSLSQSELSSKEHCKQLEFNKDKAEAYKRELLEKNETLLQDNDQLRQQCKAAEEAYARNASQIQRFESTEKEAQEYKRELLHQNESLLKDNDQLREKCKTAKEIADQNGLQVHELKEALDEQRKRYCHLDEKCASSDKQIEFMTVEAQRLHEKYKGLENVVTEVRNEMNTTKENHSLEKMALMESISKLEAKLETSVTDAANNKRLNEREKAEMKAELDNEKQNNEKMNQQMFTTIEQFEHDRNKLLKQIAEKDFALAELQKRCKAMMKQLNSLNTRESALFEKILLQEEIRRSLHNKVMQLSGNIRVFVRVRPQITNEISSAESPFTFPTIFDKSQSSSVASVNIGDDLTKRFIVATEPPKDRGGLSQRQKTLKYGFDNVFDPSHDQESIWNATEPLIQSAVDGYNVCVFAYGQTGSGKTFTMLGNEQNPGLITNAIKMLFNSKRELEEASKGKSKVQISIELLEIYNEHVRDLLGENKGNAGYTPINLSLSSNEAVGNVVYEAANENSVMFVLDKAQKRRCVKATKSNAESSRSHLIFTLNYNVVNTESGSQRSSKLSICDLAGSERLSKSESYGEARTECQYINKSLSSLSNVIEKLQQKSSHIPFRESKLTYLLQNSLGGDSKTLAIVCCNPMAEHFQESTCSLRFAQKLNKVELKALGNVSC